MNLFSKNKGLFFLIFILGNISFAYSQSVMDTTFSFQSTKSTSKIKKHSPKIAALSSAILPGLGQIYNGQWYKAPVIYAGAGVMWYFIDMNLKERKIYDKELLARSAHDSSAFNLSLNTFQTSEILRIRNYYQSNFELSLIITGVIYLLNIVDAVVYAHLFSFDVSDNLSLKITPYAQPNYALRSSMPLDGGLKLCFTFK